MTETTDEPHQHPEGTTPMTHQITIDLSDILELVEDGEDLAVAILDTLHYRETDKLFRRLAEHYGRAVSFSAGATRRGAIADRPRPSRLGLATTLGDYTAEEIVDTLWQEVGMFKVKTLFLNLAAKYANAADAAPGGYMNEVRQQALKALGAEPEPEPRPMDDIDVLFDFLLGTAW